MTVSGADGTDEARPATAPVVPRLHRAALIEDRVPPSLIVGCAGMAGVSVLCRLLVMVRQAGYVSWPAPLLARPCGWRSFLTWPVKDTPVTIEVAGRNHELRTDRAGDDRLARVARTP